MARLPRLLRLSHVDSPDEQHVRVLWLSGTLALGPVFALIWLALPHPENANTTGILAMCLVAWITAAALRLAPTRLVTDGVLKAALWATTAVISGAVAFGGDPGLSFALFYLWEAPYSFSYFRARDGVWHTAWVGVCYAGVLVVQHAGDPASGGLHLGRWFLLIGSFAVVGTLVRWLTLWGRDSNERFRRGFDDSPVPMMLMGLDERCLEVNDSMCRLLGSARAELEGEAILGVVHRDDVDAGRAGLWRIASGDALHENFECRLVRNDGEELRTSVSVSAVRDLQGRALYFLIQVQDVTQARRNVEELQRRGHQQQEIARLGQLALTDPPVDEFIAAVAAAVTATLGVEMGGLIKLDPAGREFHVLAAVGVPPEMLDGLRIPARPGSAEVRVLSCGQPIVVEDTLDASQFEIDPIAHELGIRSTITVVVDGAEEPFGVLAIASSQPRAFCSDDVAFVQAAANLLSGAIERRRADDANRFAALHDPLTGLANRTLALDRIEHALARRQRDRATVAVMVLDVDRFKVINDSLGHEAGDDLLVRLAPRLRDTVRPSDTVARLGGDEFVVVCEDAGTPADVIRIAERLAAAINAPVAIQGGEHVMTASIGIAIAGPDDDTPATLLRDADAAMYRAKDGGRGRYELFDDGMREQVLLRMRTESELRRAIGRGELRVHYQPIIDVASGRTSGVEALVRWQHPERGLLGPVDFIPVAEETGLIASLGGWVLAEAARQVAAWQSRFGHLELCVNVSVRQLASPTFADEVARIAAVSGIMPGTLGLEITESVLIESAGAPVAALQELHERGVRLLLDDFGIGYSSLSYVKNFPLDALKLDRSFIAGFGVNPEDTAIVDAVIRMARVVGMAVVAEGVETETQLAQLRGLGCAAAQGYLFARPMPAADLERFLAAQIGAAAA